MTLNEDNGVELMNSKSDFFITLNIETFLWAVVIPPEALQIFQHMKHLQISRWSYSIHNYSQNLKTCLNKTIEENCLLLGPGFELEHLTKYITMQNSTDLHLHTVCQSTKQKPWLSKAKYCKWPKLVIETT